MIIKFCDKIHFAMYGNFDYMINILNLINKYKDECINSLVVNNQNMNYVYQNTSVKYLIIKINDKIFTLNENDKITFIYDRDINIIITRTDENIYYDIWLKNILKFYKNSKIYIIYNFDIKNELINIPDYVNIIENKIYDNPDILPYYYILFNKLKGNFLILNDKVILNHSIDINSINKNILVKEHNINEDELINTIKLLNNSNILIDIYKKISKKFCFEGLSFINSVFLNKANEKFNLSILFNKSEKINFNINFNIIFSLILYYFTNNNISIFENLDNNIIFTNLDKYFETKSKTKINYIY